MPGTVKQVLLLVVTALCLVPAAWAQGTGEITGIITEPTGAVIANTEVKLINSATNVVRTTQTTAAGVYRFINVPVVGLYAVEIAAKGFQPTRVIGIVVTVGTVSTQDIRLKIGPASETVTVPASPELAQPTTSALSQLLYRQLWTSLPNLAGDPNAFVELVAGSVPQAQSGQYRSAVVNGARSGAGNFLLDGTSNYEQGEAGAGQVGESVGGSSTAIPPDAIQEVRVVTHGFPAEFGQAGGFIVDTALRSGTNAFHGSLFEYNRVQALAANNFFSNRTEDPLNPGHTVKDSLVRNQFGGSLGGPVIKNKTFFFVSADIHRLRYSEPVRATAANGAFLDWVNAGGLQRWAESDPFGICMQNLGSACPGAFAHSASLGPLFNSISAISGFPTANIAPGPCYPTGNPNDPNLYDSLANPCAGQGVWTSPDFRTRYLTVYPMSPYGDIWMNTPTAENEYRISGKVDHRFSDKDQISAFYLLQDADWANPYLGGQGALSSFTLRQLGRGQNVGITWNHSFSPTVLHVLKAAYLRHVLNFPSPPGTNGMPSMGTAFDALQTGIGAYGALPQDFTDNQFQFQEQLSFVHGKHSFKTGWEYRRIRNGSYFVANRYGFYGAYSLEDLLTDLYFDEEVDRALFGEPVLGSATAVLAVDNTTGKSPDFYRGFRANEIAAYFQDDWRITPRLTFNWGIRWEYFGPPHNFKPGTDSNFYFGTNVTPIATTSTNPFFPKNNPFYAGVATATYQIRDHEIWNKDTNNFGFRLGFAWDVLGNQKLVLRVGGGIMYDRIFNNVYENIRFNPPFFALNGLGYFTNYIPIGSMTTPGIYSYPFSSTSFAYFNDPKYAAVSSPRHMAQGTVTPYYEQVHAGIQSEFAKNYLLEVNYVGTFGHKLFGYRNINTFNGRMACANTYTSLSNSEQYLRCQAAGWLTGWKTTRINTTVAADNYRSNDYSSNYHGMQVIVRKAFSSGLQFDTSYTWSKALDTMSDIFMGRNSPTVTDTMNPNYDYGPADFDMRHRFVATLVYELPFLKKNQWLGGWSVNTALVWQSGVHISPQSGDILYDANKDGTATDRLVPVGGSAGSTLNNPGLDQGWGHGVPYFDPSRWVEYSCPMDVNQGLWCNPPIGRNTMVGPGFEQIDMGLGKTFKVAERINLTVQANFFNLLNHTNFNLPNAFKVDPAHFGTITAAYPARQTQLALRLDF